MRIGFWLSEDKFQFSHQLKMKLVLALPQLEQSTSDTSAYPSFSCSANIGDPHPYDPAWGEQ